MADARASLLITARGRADLLRRSLARLGELTRPAEVVVVDDGTPDDSVRDACAWAARWTDPLSIRYIYNDNPGDTNCCHARNVGLRACAHDEVIVTEPELWFVSDVVAQMAEARGGRPDAVLCAETCYHSQDSTKDMRLDLCDRAQAWPYVNSWRRDWLVELGGWDEGLPGPWGWDDIDLLGRAAHNGHPQEAVPGLEVHHQWHPSRIEPAAENEEYVRAKELPRDLVANKLSGWGAPLERGSVAQYRRLECENHPGRKAISIQDHDLHPRCAECLERWMNGLDA